MAMNSNLFRRDFLLRLGLAVGLLGFCTKTHAAWSSVHANNRDQNVQHRTDTRTTVTTQTRQRETPTPAPEPRARVTPERGASERGREHVVESQERAHEVSRAHENDRFRERRRLDIDDDRHRAFFWHDYHPGMIIGTLPLGYAQITVGTTPYYYYDGIYYNHSPSGYVVEAPPLGAVVAEPPPGADVIEAGGNVYYYAGGAFYEQQPNGYAVVPAPMGVTVNSLPPGASAVAINGTTYYVADGVYYLPVMQDGVTVFTTVRP